MKALKVLLMSAVVFLTACSTMQDTRKYGVLAIKNGRWADYIEGYEKEFWKDSMMIGMDPVVIESWACRSFFEIRDFKRFDTCAQGWFQAFGDNKIPEGYRVDDFPGPFKFPWRDSLNFYNIALHSMYATFALEVGDLSKAETSARTSLSRYTPWIWFLNQEDMNQNEWIRIDLIRAHRVLAHVGARQQDEKLFRESISWMDDRWDIIRHQTQGSRYALMEAYVSALMAKGDYSEAKAFLEQVDDSLLLSFGHAFAYTASLGLVLAMDLSDVEGFDDKENQASMDFLKAKLEFETGNKEAAVQLYKDFLINPKLIQSKTFYVIALHDLAKYDLKQGNYSQAFDRLSTAIDVVESQRASMAFESAKIGFIADKQAMYSDIVLSAIKLQNYEEAFNYVERGKSRALVDMLANKKQFKAKGIDNKRVTLDTDSLSTELGLESELALSHHELKQSGTRALKRKVTQIKKTSPEVASLISVDTMGLSDIQKSLSSNETLIEYFGTSDNQSLYVFVIQSNSIKVRVLSVNQLEENISSLRSALLKPNSNHYEKYSRALYQDLFKPLERDVANSELVIVPHGPLNYLPFNVLKDEQGRFLIDQYNVRKLPSASVSKYLEPKRLERFEIVALGNPDVGDSSLRLPGAEREVRQISNRFELSSMYLGKDANETVLKNQYMSADIIHIASHGEFNAESPLDSRLLLASDTQNDGSLTVREIYDLNLNANLVTLSACETGLGDVRTGGDVLGLTRSFMFAGTQNVVASLWIVDDKATQHLMTDFYSELKTETVRKSLRQAQLRVKKRPGYQHPFFWAAFEVTGTGV